MQKKVRKKYKGQKRSMTPRKHSRATVPLKSKFHLTSRIKIEFMVPDPVTQLLSCFFGYFMFVCKPVKNVKREDAVIPYLN